MGWTMMRLLSDMWFSLGEASKQTYLYFRGYNAGQQHPATAPPPIATSPYFWAQGQRLPGSQDSAAAYQCGHRSTRRVCVLWAGVHENGVRDHPQWLMTSEIKTNAVPSAVLSGTKGLPTTLAR